MERVVVLGASQKPDRYSHMAVKLLMEHGHEVYPINRVQETILGLKAYKCLGDVDVKVDTLTLYVNPKLVESEVENIINLSPGRVIFNPGTESEAAMAALEEKGIKVVKACTLVMLKTDQY